MVRNQIDVRQCYDGVSDETLDALRKQITDTEQAVRQLTDGFRTSIPGYDAITRGGIFRLQNLTDVLNPGEAVAFTTVGRKEIFVWVIAADDTVSGHSLDRNAANWRREVGRVRRCIDPGDGILTRLKRFNSRGAHRIYDDLLDEHSGIVQACNQLIFVTDNTLANLPLSITRIQPVANIPETDLMFAGFWDLPWLIRSH